MLICHVFGERSKQLRIEIVEDIAFHDSTIGKLKNSLNSFKKHIKYEFFKGWKIYGAH